MKTFLDVGSGAERVKVPRYFQGWRRERLDIDPRLKPEILLDARELLSLPAATYDAVYCCHNLEHYFLHDALRVVRGFVHVLKPDGFAEARVPDVGALIRHVAANDLDMDSVLFRSSAGPITVRDVFYGYQLEIRQSGQEFYAHRNGFTDGSLVRLFTEAGFGNIVTAMRDPFGLVAFGFKSLPSRQLLADLRLGSVQLPNSEGT